MVKREGLPEINELVLCTVVRITPYAAWAKLDEYPNVEGMIHVSEVAGKWVHDIREFVKQNKQYVCKVMRVDPQKNVINLSMKRVSKFDEKEKINAVHREERAEKILEQAGNSLKKNLNQSYEEVGFLLQEKFGELYAAFEEINNDKTILATLEIPEKWQKALLAVIEKSFKEREIILKAELELKSYKSSGLNDIKKLLKEIESTGVHVTYISAPRYLLKMKTNNPKSDEKKMREDLEKIMQESKELQVESSYRFVK